MSLKVIATILLIERLISAAFITMVIRRQIALFKMAASDTLQNFRRVLFYLSLAIFVGNFIPILIDALTIAANLEGRSNPAPIGIAYAISNASTAMLSSIFVWVLYRMAAQSVFEEDRTGKRERRTDK